MGRLFGTDGVRGIANTELTALLAFQLGQAGALVLTKHSDHQPRILVGKDTRASGDMLEAALVAGICSVGAQAVLAGVVPTPAVAYLTRANQMDAGVVISASHNSMEYNGIKFFSADGYKLPDSVEEEIEEYILDGKSMGELPIGAGVGRVSTLSEAKREYIEFIKGTVSGNFEGMRIAIDCANGASSVCAQDALCELGAEVVAICDTPDGSNINLNCGSTHMEGLQQLVREGNFDLGLAFDGDADRLLAVDQAGEMVDGDKIMAVCARSLAKQGKLAGNTVVATVMSNLGFFLALDEMGISYAQTKVGDRYVLEHMLENGYVIGGEQSGHIIFLEHNTTGDGLLTAVQLVSVLRDSGGKMSELASAVNVLPQVLVNAHIRNEYKETYAEDTVIAAEIRRIEEKFHNNGRVLIRPSGTEPLVRVMLEGSDVEEIRKDATALASLLEERLG
ncbi:MAG: phosphoglucosamine mutase [Ruminococcaceae bacterium]|nr:phosphoglucosamine mutase [Oscillospiraceae bacterium]